MLILLLVFAQAPSISLPPSIQAKPGRLIQIVAKTDAKTVRWFLSSPTDADLIIMESTKSAIFSATEPGKYRLVAYTAIADVPSEPAICDITVGSLPAPPVIPSDPLATSIAAIWGALDEPEKLASKEGLVQAYKAGLALTSDPKILDVGAFNASLIALRRARVGDSRLVTIRDRISDEWATLGNDPSAPFTADTRLKAASIINRVIAALEVLR
jgi:hypothetical protein